MLKVNDYVRYGAKGIFKIIEIQKRKNKDNKKVNWYVLYSNSDGVDTKILTPADNPTLRKIMSKEEALEIIEQMNDMEIIWDNNKRTRDELFHDILASGDMKKMAQLMKSIYFIRYEKLQEGKDIAQKDKDVFNNAEKLLFEELSLSFNIQKNEVLDFIMSKVTI